VARAAARAVAAGVVPAIAAVAGVGENGSGLASMHYLIRDGINKQHDNGIKMDTLVILAAIGFGGWWLYRSGKRYGSRKGFAAGRRAHRRRKRRR
jgi:hypothetical protein